MGTTHSMESLACQPLFTAKHLPLGSFFHWETSQKLLDCTMDQISPPLV